MTTPTDLTPDTLALFTSLASDAGNWSDTPLVTVTSAQKGNLTDLKKLGLIKTDTDSARDGGNTWAYFTPAGSALAAELGYEVQALAN